MTCVQYVRAFVIDNKDPEKLGRVKVRYVWLGGKASEQPSQWALVSTNLQHTESGDWLLPEVHDEVLVCFENDSRTHPIVLGSLLAKKSKLPATGRKGDGNKDKNNSLRALVSNSGHTLALDDTEGNREIHLKDASGHEFLIRTDKKQVLLKDPTGNSFQTLGDSKELKLQSTQGHVVLIQEKSIEITDSSGQAIILDGEHILIKDKNENFVQLGEKGMSLKSSKKISLASESKIAIDGKSKVLLGEGVAQAMLKGNAFMQAFNTHVHPGSEKTATPMTPAMLSQKVKLT